MSEHKSIYDLSAAGLADLAASKIPGPGIYQESFNLLSLFNTNPAVVSEQEIHGLNAYLQQLRKEIVHRLLPVIFDPQSKEPNKWWFQFAKRKFVGTTLWK